MPVEQILYSEKYSDDVYDYRHVILPMDIARLVPRSHLMTETEWRNLGVQQSPGWMHFMIHSPEPHVLLFRRPKETPAPALVEVSWIRHRDLHILTVGGYTYTSDQRFQATHAAATGDWTLHIKWAQQRDAGVYECQVSTQPVRSFFVTLNVVVPSARILGGPDLHVDMGSTINLTCVIQFSPEPPTYIFWYHEDEVISYQSSRGGVSVVTEKGAATTSYLLVQEAAPSDSGRYSCSPSNAEVASVRVHVLNGERPAAMQTGSAGLSSSSASMLGALVLAVLHGRMLRAHLDS